MADDLAKLEPTPTHEPQDFPSASPQTQPPPSPLGLSSHSPTWYLLQAQRYSTYALSAFALMHITNTSLIPLLTRSVPASEPYLLLTRPYYQSPLAEPLLVALPLWTHILSGVGVRVLRRNQNAKRFGDAWSRDNQKNFFTRFWPRVSGISKLGFVAAPLVVGHMVVNRLVPRARDVDVNLGFVSHAFARHAVVSYVGFAALVGVTCWHVVWGWAKWLGLTPEMVREEVGAKREVVKRRRWWGINVLAAAVTGLWLTGSFGEEV